MSALLGLLCTLAFWTLAVGDHGLNELPGFVLDMPPAPLGMTVAALQGLMNQRLGRPAVFVRKMPSDAAWFQTAMDLEPSLRPVKFREVQWTELLEEAVSAGAVGGRVLVNFSEPWSFAGAVSLAALHRAIPIDANHPLEHIPLVADVRGKWVSQVEATMDTMKSALSNSQSHDLWFRRQN